jgi:hypothetical protein
MSVERVLNRHKSLPNWQRKAVPWPEGMNEI